MYYIDQLVEGSWIKAGCTVVTYYCVTYLHLDFHILYLYLAFTFLDVFLGRRLAKIMHTYDRRRMGYWVRKQGTHMMLAVLVGLLGYATTRTSPAMGELEAFGAPINFFLLFLIYTEAASVEEKLKLLGFPVPAFLHKLLSLMRKKTAHSFAKLLDDPEAREELEKALRERADEDSKLNQ